MPFGAILGAVVPKVVGGLFQRKSEKKATASREKQLQSLVVDAKKAGFNPLTALREGGAPSYVAQPPQLSSAEFFADALGDGIETAFNGDQRKRDAERDRLETEVLKAELKAIQEKGKVAFDRNFGYSIPHATTTTGVHDVLESGLRSGLSGRRLHGDTQVKDDIPPILKPFRAENGDIVMLPNPDLPDLDQFGVAITGGVSASAQASSRQVSTVLDRVTDTFSNFELPQFSVPDFSRPPRSGPMTAQQRRAARKGSARAGN
ncbi:hypothetical protein [Epibacterium ulvae]|uniref:hypothetical protein n=1 Tax=Epibacterium ulvae TaxID=1156985 RepID=UPI000C224AEA|nr:hypothetical protein [Epibacterium ulvae]